MKDGAWPYTCRAIEIKAWLTLHPEVTHYVVLDDEIDFSDRAFVEHTILINSFEGLTPGTVLEAAHCLLYGKYCFSMSRNMLSPIIGEPLDQPCDETTDLHDLKQFEKAQSLGIAYEQLTFRLTYDHNADMEHAIESVTHLAKQGLEELALCYGLAMLITFQTNHAYLYARYVGFCGLLCQIAINLGECKMAKMLLRIADGQLCSSEELDSSRNDYLTLTRLISEIPADQSQRQSFAVF